jgi:hypothetical protein
MSELHQKGFHFIVIGTYCNEEMRRLLAYLLRSEDLFLYTEYGENDGTKNMGFI